MSTRAVLAILDSQLKGYISLIENYHQWILFFHHKVHNHFCDELGPVVTIHIPGLHWVKCFICNAVLATKCTNTWSLIIAYIILHVISMIFQIREYLFMPTYFITFLAWQFMLTSVWYTPLSKLTQADPHIPFVCPQHGVSWYQDKTVFSDLRPTCTLTHWGLVTIWQQNFGHHCFNQWPVPSMVPSECLNQLLHNIN